MRRVRASGRVLVVTALLAAALLPTPAKAAELPAGLEPPVAVTQTAIVAPAEAPPITEPVVVRVKIVVGSDGAVRKVERVDPPAPPWDDAVIATVQTWGFSPGRFNGKPVAVAIAFTHTFMPPPPPPPTPMEAGVRLDGHLSGRIVEKGTRAPAASVSVAAEVDGKRYRAFTDRKGRFALALPSGEARITLHGAGYLPFLQREEIKADEAVKVAYYIERERYDPYEIVVFGKQRREELSRITLRGPEIRQVPGTFGDPFRVVATLPGVSSVMSLLPMPVVRGASPGSTGFLLDGTRIPLLFHMLGGPSVIHPYFIEEVRFYPGGAPVIYGGYTAGIIDGRTRRARADEVVIDADINLLQTGGLVRVPVKAIGATLTVAGRVGYPGVILSLATKQASLSYWDYQLRLDGGNARSGWTVFAFGAWDEVKGPAEGSDPADPEPPLEPVLQLGFHRLDLRAHHGKGRWDTTFRLVSGADTTLTGPSNLTKWVVEPTARAHFRPNDTLELVGGVEGFFHDTDITSDEPTPAPDPEAANQDFNVAIKRIYGVTALTEALWRPTPRWLLRPGVRVDYRADGETGLFAADPRFAARYRVGVLTWPGLAGPATSTGNDGGSSGGGGSGSGSGSDAVDDARATWVKAGIGVFHQPPRLFLPLPGLDTLPLRFGLLQAIQSSIGAEFGLGDGFSFNVEGYYNHMDPVVFDLEINPASVVQQAQTSLVNLDPTAPDSGADAAFDRLFAAQKGRAMGLEFMLRKQSRSGPYGWVSYTLSLSEREKSGTYAPYDFDRTHLLNVVAGLQLPRNWDLGLRLQYQSGKPATTTYGYNTARGDSFVRVDVRVDKRAVYKKWLFDFYVDVTNIALLPEEIFPGQRLRYVLPTVGFRAHF